MVRVVTPQRSQFVDRDAVSGPLHFPENGPLTNDFGVAGHKGILQFEDLRI